MSVSRLFVSFILLACLYLLPSYGSFAAPPLCSRSDLAGVADELRSQCPLWIERFVPEEVQGDTLDKKLAHVEDGAYFSVLFYASWCPFSQNIKPSFDALSSMFPQIWHLKVEESSAMPSVFSRYGIHSFPSILLANRTSRIRYHGSKDLNSLAHFYRQTTGQDPVAYFSVDQPKENINVVQPSHRPAGELLKNEPYLAFSLLFILLRAFTYFFPKFISKIKSFRILHTFRHANLRALSELTQPLVRFLHVIDMKRAWNKLHLSNTTRNLHKGAKNARVWASSLASMSLGESSSLRSAHLN
ncbi:5'-adenylylsulfate reductase-like 5 isoform X2 [Phalaenopsis equestris]|uniref:5'-adenylylsulfate reductase-like 5 isoform X2 n=1 Tax=Phalaenopsis equestris TaxID=78828 RepID=UPI0009E4223E|nr:5'-adenylylsulfate reductase-like 5 isoform X2 [Phalaenopsis equestris]